MFSNIWHSGILSLFFSLGVEPLQLWSRHHDGTEKSAIRFITDEILESTVLELYAQSEAQLPSTFIRCPAEVDSSQLKKSLDIKLPYLILQIRNMEKYFSFEFEILDDQKQIRRFRASNWISKTDVLPEICLLPLQLDPDWVSISIDLTNLCKRTYGTTYKHFLRIQIHASCRIRRIYMNDALIRDQDLPAELKLYAPKK